MDNKRDRKAIIAQSTQKTEEGQMELYLYSLRKMAEQNVETNRNPVTQLYNLRAYFSSSRYPKSLIASIVKVQSSGG